MSSARSLMRNLLGAIAFVALCGCSSYHTGEYYADYYDDYPYDDYTYGTDPSLAYIGDDVWAVEGYSYPLFYANGIYWRYYNGYWYNSPYYYGGWTYRRPSNVPSYIRGIYRPNRYRYYRAPAGTRVRHGGQGDVYIRRHDSKRYPYRGSDYQRRDHRSTPTPRPGYQRSTPTPRPGDRSIPTPRPGYQRSTPAPRPGYQRSTPTPRPTPTPRSTPTPRPTPSPRSTPAPRQLPMTPRPGYQSPAPRAAPVRPSPAPRPAPMRPAPSPGARPGR